MTRIVHPHFPVEKLPEELRASFKDQSHVRLVIDDKQEDAALLAEFDAKIQEGLDDIETGRVHSAEEVRRLLKERFGATRSAAE
jgi:hypothetical protein